MMSESPSSQPRRRHSGASSLSRTGSIRSSTSVVRPSPVTETSLMETVGSFINDVQAFNTVPHASGSDHKVQVTWARFEIADVNDDMFFPEVAEVNGNNPPLLLILGYTSGVQAWLIPVSGEAQEILSWKQGQVKVLRILPTPENAFGVPDNFSNIRPMVAMSDNNSGNGFTSCTFLSLKTGEQAHNIKFNSEICDIHVNRKVVLISFREKLAVFNASNLEARFTITSCFPSPGVDSNPIALGDRWLAYADRKLTPIHKSFGGMETDGNTSVTAWSINMGSKLAQGVSKIYSNFFSGKSVPSSVSATTQNDEPQKGIVTVLDILRVYHPDNEEVSVSDKIQGVIAHFIAHSKAVVALKFDPSGSLLLTCDRLGNYFYLYRIVPHPSGSCYSAVHHLYSLYRGDTPGTVQDIAFSSDSRWVAVSTLRGTTHIFPITPYGGSIGVRTHTSHRVVNRLSRFHRSAGIDLGGRTSPNPSLGSSPGGLSETVLPPPPIVPHSNPLIPPFPSPTPILPVAQLRQPYLMSSLQSLGGSVSKKSAPGGRGRTISGSATLEDIPIRLACTFAPSRAWLVGAQHNMFSRAPRSKTVDALYVMANHGVLLEYSLEPVPDTGLPKEKICESSPIELLISTYGQWSLTKPRDRSELQPPLPIDNPLMLGSGGSNIPTLSPQFSMDDEEHWLSQVEIITHIGPHRRLWMGPQFSFKTLQSVGSDGIAETELVDVSSRPIQSNPISMKGHKCGPVLIEAGSAASSFELSPKFHNQYYAGSKEHILLDLESELQEAMSDNSVPKESTPPLPDGSSSRGQDEEFFCISGGQIQESSVKTHRSRNPSSSTSKPHEVSLANDSKIFSVAVESGKAGISLISDDLAAVDLDSDYQGLFAVVSSSSKSIQSAIDREVTPKFKAESAENLLRLSSEHSSSVENLLAEATAGVVSLESHKTNIINVMENSPVKKEDSEESSEERFYISDRVLDDEEEEEDEIDHRYALLPDADGAKPEVGGWGNLDCNSIMNDIKTAERKYETRSLSNERSKTFGVCRNTATTDSSEDESAFTPAQSSRKSRKKKNNSTNKTSLFESESTTEDEVNPSKSHENEGWSFEADDADVNKLLSEVQEISGEKANLDDVFKFDSEMAKPHRPPTEIDNNSVRNTSGGGTSTGGFNSESSSIGNSPNPKKSKNKVRKKKSKKSF